MTGRRPARLLAPLALVVCAVALFAVVKSGGESSDATGGSARPEATATTKSKAKKGAKAKALKKTYTVKAGDTPSSIAQKTGVSLGELLDANPNADPNALKLGQKLKLP